MDFHVDRSLRLNTKSEHASLYTWSVAEVDEHGAQVGQDQIPWPWRLYFTAVSLVLSDSIEIKKPYAEEGEPPVEVSQRRVIRAKLRPGDPRHDGIFSRQTTYQMFGVNRVIKDFQLDIMPLADPAESESCTAWGSVSYTAETDFREETTEDCLVFYLMVKPETFDSYARRIADATADEVILSVGQVSGFYSEWSPSISTRDVKVLTSGEEHAVPAPEGVEFNPPRLGDIGEAELYVNTKRSHAVKPDAAADDDELPGPTIGEIPATDARPRPAPDPQLLKALTSLRTVGWWIAGILGLILISTWFRR